MKVAFVQEATAEFFNGISHYQAAHPDLGRRFLEEVERMVSWIARHPEVARVRPGGYRRVNLRAFPYYIAYLTKRDVLWVLAVAHGARKPEYWIKRIKSAH